MIWLRLIIAFACVLTFIPTVAWADTKVVASFSILADMAAHVAGPHAVVSAIIGPNRDAHGYEPTAADAKALAAADIVLVNGLGFEGFLDRLVAASGTKARVVTVSTGITTLPAAGGGGEHDHGVDHGHGEHGHGKVDPHGWQSLDNAMVYVDNIRKALSQADPAHAGEYAANARTYIGSMQELKAWTSRQLTGIPADRRRILTAHDSLGYLGRDLGLTILPVRGITSHAEPSAKDMRAIIGQIRSQKVRALFMENVNSDKLIQQISKETGAVVGGVLYSDALSGPGGPAADYLSLYRHNVTQIVAALR